MIIVTGGAGFIGSALIKKLNELGYEDIIVVDRLRDGAKWLNLRGLKFSDYVHADQFLESKYLRGGIGIRAVYHMGACSATTEKNVDYLMDNNVKYSQALFTFCAENNLPFCYASSAATYGAGEQGYDDSHEYVTKLRPLNAYGYSKQLFDEWVLKQRRYPEKWYGVKFFNVYGPNEYHKGRMSSVVYQAFNQINSVGEVKLFKSYKEGFADGEQLRDFVYVKDVVNAMVGLIQTSGKSNSGLYNLGSGKARSFKDLVAATFRAMGLPEKIVFIEMPEDLKNQYQYFTEAKMSKLFTALPDFKGHTLEEGVSDYVKNYLLNENQYMDGKNER